jgi:CBS domain-containing protein
MKAADVMTRQVITISADASILQAARLMLQNRISGLPVVDQQGQLVGVITEGDFLRRAETGSERHRPSWLEFLVSPGRLADEYVHTHGRKVEEVMSRSPQTICEDASLEEVVRTMVHKKIKRVPVMRDGMLVGIITRADLLHALVSVARVIPPIPKDDTAIRDRIVSEIDKLPWRPAGVSVLVRDGSVELSGTILDERAREGIRVLVENVPGVRAIHDHMVWVEPLSGMAFSSPDDEDAAAASGKPMATGSLL